MLFYTTIFVICLIAAVVLPWLYHLISGVGTTIHRAIRPDSDKGPTSHLETSQVRNGAVPWDLHAPRVIAREYGVRTKADGRIGEDNSYYGPRNSYSELAPSKTRMPNDGWIHREDKTALIGNTYKVTRRLKTREKNPRIVSKPSSW